ncbi:MAG: hypothetical protein AB1349_03360, partial [Elusimicrobiota bacterium]
AHVQSLEGTFMYNKLFLGLDNINLGQMHTGFVYPTDNSGSFGLNINDTYLSALYREDTFALGYANDTAPFFWDKEPPFPILGGFSIKYLLHKYILDERTKSLKDPVFANGTSAGAFTTDIGILLLPFSERLAIGLAVKNLVKADVGLYHKDFVPQEYRAGLAYKIEKWKFVEDIVSTVDFSYRKPENNVVDIKIAGGLETWFSKHTYSARLGGSDREITAGFSFNKVILNIGIQLDYAFLWPLQLADTSGSHRLSLTFRQGGEPAEKQVKVKREKGKREKPKEEKPAEILPPPPPAPQPTAVEETPAEAPELTPERRQALMKLHYESAYKHFQKGEYELAIAGWQEVLKLDPNHEEAKRKIELAKQKLDEKQKKTR